MTYKSIFNFIQLDKSTPISVVGIDYIGLLYMKNVYNDQLEDEHQLFKCYVVLHTCATTHDLCYI